MASIIMMYVPIKIKIF